MPRTFDDDPLLFPHLPGILAHLQKVMEEDRLPLPCTITPVPGEIVALDYLGDDCDTFAWARITGSFPAINFPNQDVAPSRALVLASTVELGLMRTFVLPDNGEAPDADQLYEATRLQMADMRAMLVALCRYGSDALDERILVGQYQPLGPEGGVLGGTWTATMPAAV